MSIVLSILVTAAALWVATALVPGIQIESSFTGFLLVAIIFGFVNAFVKPIIKLLSLPVTILTLGLFLFVINALMLLLTAWLVGNVMSIAGSGLGQFFTAMIGSIVISIASAVISWIVPGD